MPAITYLLAKNDIANGTIEGMNGDRLMYFQHTDISRVVFEGYVDDDEIMMCDNIFNAMEKTEIERADVRKLKRSMVN